MPESLNSQFLPIFARMSTFLFDKIVFGPVMSRRLGVSLGINLLPLSKKYCNFDCIYCECGRSHLHDVKRHDIPSREEVAMELENVLMNMKQRGSVPDVITFAGNGEPTMHPEFAGIVDDTVRIRDEVFPGCRISLLSNSTLLHKKSVREALHKLDVNILKLDTAIEETFIRLDKPNPGITLEKIIDNLINYDGPMVVQTLFVRGPDVDNTTKRELDALIEVYHKIDPDSIMVYSFERDTPTPELEKAGRDELERIAVRLREEGFDVEVS